MRRFRDFRHHPIPGLSIAASNKFQNLMWMFGRAPHPYNPNITLFGRRRKYDFREFNSREFIPRPLPLSTQLLLNEIAHKTKYTILYPRLLTSYRGRMRVVSRNPEYDFQRSLAPTPQEEDFTSNIFRDPNIRSRIPRRLRMWLIRNGQIPP